MTGPKDIMVDVKVLVSRVRGIIANPKETFSEHMQPVPPWSLVLRQHVLPLLVATGLLASLLILAFPPGSNLPGFVPPDLTTVAIVFLIRFVASLVALFAFTVIIGLLAVLFDGQPRFSSAFTLVALAMTPVYLAEGVGPLPVIGPILAIAGLIYSMMLLYQGVPMALKVPDNKRVFHFILTLATMFVLSIVAASALFPFEFNPATGLPAS